MHIYPEGERGFDGQFHEFKEGAAILATELNVPIIPVALDGLYRVWPRHSWRIRLAKVRVRFGTPFYARDILPATAAGLTPSEKYTLVIDHLKRMIVEMVDDMRRDDVP